MSGGPHVRKRSLVLAAVLAATVGTTLAGAAVQATAHASATARGLIVGDARFFPTMLIDQCAPTDVARGRSLGINLIMNESCPGVGPLQQLATMRGSALAVLPIAAARTRGAGLVGWTYPDEPENNGWTPDSLAKKLPYRRGNTDGLVTFMTTGGGFLRLAPYASAQTAPAVYGKFARLADMAGFDLYPLGHCQSNLSAVYDAQRAFVKLAGSTPTFQWIETGPIKPTYCGGFTMSPAQLSAEVWLAVVGGARGIGYFTHTWSPEHQAFDVTPAVQTAMTQTNALLSSVTPGLLGTTVASTANSPVVKVLARTGGGKTYVFAVNTTQSDVKAQIQVPALGDGSVSVAGENRSLTVANHALVDHFGPLQVNVYVETP
jgi:hypothetical protein